MSDAIYLMLVITGFAVAAVTMFLFSSIQDLHKKLARIEEKLEKLMRLK